MPARKRTSKQVFFISPLGRDTWSGTRATARRDGSDGPFATPGRALAAVREARQSGHRGPLAVRLRGGVYRPTKPLCFQPGDGGAPGAPVVWEAYRQERPCLDGSRQLTGWQRLTEPLPGLPAEAGGELYITALPAGWHFSQLFWDGRPLPRAASTPDADWRTWPVCQVGDDPDGEVRVPAGILPRNDDAACADLNFMPTPYTRWSNAIAAVKEIARRRRRIRFAPIHLPRPDKLQDIPFRLENLVGGLTAPGRWFLDSRHGRLYLWPPAGEAPETHVVAAPFLEELLRAEGAPETPLCHLVLRGLALRHTRVARSRTHSAFETRGAAVRLDNVTDSRIEECHFSGLGGWAVSGGPHLERVRIRHCTVENSAAGGFRLHGALGPAPCPCRANRVEDNTLHHLGRLYWHSAAIAIGQGEANRVAHNHIHHMPYVGIAVGGGPRHTYFRGWPRRYPDLEVLWRRHGAGEPTIDKIKRFTPGHNRIEKNCLHHVMEVLDDGAAIYCHAGHHEVMAHNVVYEIRNPRAMGLYFDDEQMDSAMIGNLVHYPTDAPGANHAAAIHLHHNGRHTVQNNVLVGGVQLLSIPNGYGGHRVEQNILVWAGEPNWDRADPAPTQGPGDGRRQDGWDAGPSRACRNLWWSLAGKGEAVRLLRQWQARGYGDGSCAADPRFRDAAGGDFRLVPGAPAYALGFKALRIDDAGPR